MERVGTLINKLKEQFEQHAEAEKMAFTAQLLLLELQKNQAPAPTAGKISVVLPAASGSYNAAEPAPETTVTHQKEPLPNNWLFETSYEIPTLSHQSELPVIESEKYIEPRSMALYSLVIRCVSLTFIYSSVRSWTDSASNSRSMFFICCSSLMIL